MAIGVVDDPDQMFHIKQGPLLHKALRDVFVDKSGLATTLATTKGGAGTGADNRCRQGTLQVVGVPLALGVTSNTGYLYSWLSVQYFEQGKLSSAMSGFGGDLGGDDAVKRELGATLGAERREREAAFVPAMIASTLSAVMPLERSPMLTSFQLALIDEAQTVVREMLSYP
ncbi:hypothetical protein [Burkholderia stagnalis]|uniref:hypothetical protein n=1 Tax=Burkholderia stagnalis TaxID=1503054 RepID=UPI0018C5DABC|nr:hypothetical protein [Burkholderia stagnalis]